MRKPKARFAFGSGFGSVFGEVLGWFLGGFGKFLGVPGLNFSQVPPKSAKIGKLVKSTRSSAVDPRRADDRSECLTNAANAANVANVSICYVTRAT